MLAKAEELLKQLVLSRSSETDNALPLAEYVSEYLTKLGLEPARYGDKDKPAVFAKSGEGGVVLSGHLDTVPQGAGWSRDQGEVVDGVMYGRGAADMKGGCAAILLAAEKLAEEGTPFAVCLTLDEEISMNGAAAVADAGVIKNSPAVLVAEPTAFDIVVREKGVIQFAIKTTGKSAHASMPVLGDNAITKMTELLHKIIDLQRVPQDPMSELTLCVNTISGGMQTNVIPDSCEARADSRFPPDMTGEDVLNLVRERLGKAEYSIETQHLLEPVETNPTLPAVHALHDIVGEKATILSVPYATEMVMFKRDNKTLMVCGPGDPTQAHILDEHIEISQIVTAVDIYVKYCRHMAEVK